MSVNEKVHTLEVFALFAALGASCSCGEWARVPLKNGVDYRPDWAAHLEEVA